MSIVDHSRSAFHLQNDLFPHAFQTVFGMSHKPDPRQDSASSINSRASADSSKAMQALPRSRSHNTLPRSNSSTLAFLSRGSSKVKPTSESASHVLTCDVAIRPSFCWNSHQEAWQSGVWSQFESGLKSCQDDAYACTNFMGRRDAAFLGVFDGHGFNGRSAAVYARKNITRWLAVDANAASKDPKRRLKALESVCAQIARGLARQELCGFDATASGLAACCALLQGDKLSVATIGQCKAILGRLDNSSSSSRLSALDLTQPETAPRAPSESTLRRLSPSMMFHKTSAPVGPPPAPVGQSAVGQGFLGRGTSGEPSTSQPAMSSHQLTSQDQIVVIASSGVWEVMTPQEVVDFVQQCRQCRPPDLSCSAALTIEAHTRWKLKFAKVIAEDVGAVVLHYGQAPDPAPPCKALPAFPQAASSNHDANDENLLHETREFWARLQPESLLPVLQTASSKGKAPMPSHFLPSRSSPSSSIPISRSSSSLAAGQGVQHADRHKALHKVPSHSSSREGSQHSQHSSQDGSVHDNSRRGGRQEGRRDSKDSNPSASSSRGTSHAGRSVRFDLPSSPDDSQNLDEADGQASNKPLQSSPVSIAFRPDTPDVLADGPGHILASSSHSSIDNLSSASPDPLDPPLRADSPSASSSQAGLSRPANNHSPPSQPNTVPRQHSPTQQHQQQRRSVPLQDQSNGVPSQDTHPGQQQQQHHRLHPEPPSLPNPFAAAADASFSASDSETSLTDLAEASLQPGPPLASASLLPKSTRTHIQHPLEDTGPRWEVASAAEPINARMRNSMERAHSAGAWSRPMRSIFPISEDRVMGSSPPEQADELEHRPIRKVHMQASGDLDDLLPAAQQPALSAETFPVKRLVAHLSLPSGYVPDQDMPDLSLHPQRHQTAGGGPAEGTPPLEGRIRGGFPRVSSHPELATISDAAPLQTTPFAGYPNMSPSSHESSLDKSFSSLMLDQSSCSLNPWAASEHSTSSEAPRRSARASALGSVHGSRSRNSSAAFDEILKLRGSEET